jgi:hypothetical protein
VTDFLRLSGRTPPARVTPLAARLAPQQAGFAVGAKIRVRVEPNRLILEVIDDERSDPSASPFSIHDPAV